MIKTPNLVVHDFQKDLEFNRDLHEYRVPKLFGTRALPSVTQILKTEGLAMYPPRNYAEAYKQIGSWIHRMIELEILGELDEENLGESMREYLATFRRFLRDSRMKPLLPETRLFHPAWRYAGTVDLFLFDPSRGTVLVTDIKTGAPRPWDDLQVAAYVNLARIGVRIPFSTIGAVLYLEAGRATPPKTGRYTLRTVGGDTLNGGVETFLSALRTRRWKDEHLPVRPIADQEVAT